VTPEGAVKKKVKALLNKVGAYYVMPVTGGYGNSGAPDFIVCLQGKFIGIECKAGRNQPTALQLSNLDRIVNAGGIALTIWEKDLDYLEELLTK
jgi:hypothetical protein